MFETKSELRKFATVTSLIAATTLSLTSCAPALSEAQKTQLSFLQSKFVDNTYVEGFTAGQADYGITIEMLLQRDGFSDQSETQKSAVAAVLEDPTLSGSVDSPEGYLFGEEGIKIDLTGKFAFASVALKADNKAAREALIDQASTAFEAAVTAPTDFAIAWLTLGLDATGKAKAADAAKALVAAQNTDGGFDDFTPGESTSDATGLALLALASVQDQVDVKAAIEKATGYLTKTLLEDHFDAYGSPNVNGTAYAFMGLKAVGADAELLTSLQTWLTEQVQPDGGVQAGFAPGTSDTMATSQAILAINGRTYLDLL
jgi:hypothetical protein